MNLTEEPEDVGGLQPVKYSEFAKTQCFSKLC